MLEDSTAQILLTDSQHLPLAQSLAGTRCHIINTECLDANWSDENPPGAIPPDQLAYLTYTSGSTGIPKGVVHNQRNVLQTIGWQTRDWHLTCQDRLSFFLSINYGASVSDIFSALLNGARLCPFALNEQGLNRLSEWLRREQITILKITPTLFRLLAEHFQPSDPPHLRIITFFGEQLRQRDIEIYRQHFPDTCVLATNYSSSETKASCSMIIDKQTRFAGNLIPVGYPIQDMRTLIWDEHGREVAAGAVGEIIVQSRYLSAGYWRRPDLPPQVFLPDPGGGDARLYRTGDLGRIRPDGMLEFLGRLDALVKIRGYRIETAEIEAALLEFSGIAQAVVVGRAENNTAEKKVVAYIVPENQPPPAVADPREFLQRRLPAYMLPANFVFLKALVLLPNGKVDQRALRQTSSIRATDSN